MEDFKKTSLQDWEQLVAKQLKTDDIYAVLRKENIEGIILQPYYGNAATAGILPRSEENTHLVARYNPDFVDQAFAVLVDGPADELTEKAVFVEKAALENGLPFTAENKYFSLCDILPNNLPAEIYAETVEKLKDLPFEKNYCIDISTHQNAGASMVQQLAVALLKAKELAEQEGPEVLNKLLFRTAIGGNYFLEISKLRALKLLIGQLGKEFGVETTGYIFAENSLRNKTTGDPENNLIRSTLELAAGMIAGADAVFAQDYKIENTDSLSEEISFKQLIVLAYESIINVFGDAAAGAFVVEDATRQLAEKAWQLFLDLEEKGGYLEVLKTGELQRMIYEHGTEEQQKVDDGSIKLIGVNLYPALTPVHEIADLYDPATIKSVRLSQRYEA
ncbi:MAG: methylmalonyl-CoA mutase [Chryseobacterium sp.]|nr:MAG: methylmalonyl-CoA mutase [Chryseobacterium sp.]